MRFEVGERGQQLEELEHDAHIAPLVARSLLMPTRRALTATSPEVGRSMPVIMLIRVGYAAGLADPATNCDRPASRRRAALGACGRVVGLFDRA